VFRGFMNLSSSGEFCCAGKHLASSTAGF